MFSLLSRVNIRGKPLRLQSWVSVSCFYHPWIFLHSSFIIALFSRLSVVWTIVGSKGSKILVYGCLIILLLLFWFCCFILKLLRSLSFFLSFASRIGHMYGMLCFVKRVDGTDFNVLLCVWLMHACFLHAGSAICLGSRPIHCGTVPSPGNCISVAQWSYWLFFFLAKLHPQPWDSIGTDWRGRNTLNTFNLLRQVLSLQNYYCTINRHFPLLCITSPWWTESRMWPLLGLVWRVWDVQISLSRMA